VPPVHELHGGRGVPLRRGVDAAADAQGVRAATVAAVPAAHPRGVCGAHAAAGEPMGGLAGHQHRVGRVHVQELRCLARRGKAKGSYDCKDCFDLGGREKDRWVRRDKEKGGECNSLDYSIDGVLGSLPRGSVRIGLDIDGGSGTFAARMRERGVTVVTTSINFDGSFNSFIASRGLVPIHLSVAF
jgi:hypothetical protein